MRQTTNFQLPSWDSDDRILRTDFNELTEKVDNALFQKLGPMELISEVTADATIPSLSLDLTGVDWNQWSIVAAFLDQVNIGEDVQESYFNVVGAEKLTNSKLSGEITPVNGIRLIILFPFRDGQQNTSAIFFPGGQLSQASNSFQNLTSIYYGTNVSARIYAGTRIRLYGIR